MKKIWLQITQSTFYVKWTNWEFYPMYIANIPTVLIWLYFAIRARSLFFFSAVNPAIETGGVLGESKINIYEHLPTNILPKTIFISQSERKIESILTKIKQVGIPLPFIVKPNVGERGFLVKKIETLNEFEKYFDNINVDFLIQEFVAYPLEISVLYHRMPDQLKGKITSICVKKNLSVVGDGTSTIEQLMQDYPRARFQLARFQKENPLLLKELPKAGQLVELEPIGNHCRGTTFSNGNHYINAQLEAVFDQIALQMKDIYYGRFDMKCESMEALYLAQSFKVLEFNGIASEPAHVYDPDYTVFQAYQDIFQHWNIIYKIYKVQRQKGVKSMTWSEAYTSIKDYRAYMRTAKS